MTFRLAVTAVLLGAIGFGLCWGGWHLYDDHQHRHADDAILHRVDAQVGAWQAEARRQQEEAKQQLLRGGGR